jgi:ribosomal protein S12 methylthiotransferase
MRVRGEKKVPRAAKKTHRAPAKKAGVTKTAARVLTKKKVHVVTMGCAKNAVDSEKLMAQLRLSDIELSPTLEGADIAVINTCGFIGPAKEESIDAIMESVRRKGKGKLEQVYAMGCLTERYRTVLAEEIPEVDAYFGSDELGAVVRTLGAQYRSELLGERVLTTPSHTAYLKISEGCDNPCSFCAIPLMRGGHVSRPMEKIVAEAALLASRGVRELVVIAQDTTYYGLDLYGERRLASLLRQVADVPGIAWVRLMYAYPAGFPRDVLDVIAGHPRICTYMDMPVQHVSDAVLKSMRRGISRRAMLELIEAAYARVPGIALRTTLIVGYPGEGDAEFQELLAFVKAAEFARLGVFEYSPEEGTTAHPLGDPVPAAEKTRRLGAIMEAQKVISEKRNESFIGKRLRVLVDRIEGGQAVGRTEYDAPEIDNEVYLAADAPLAPGEFHEALITDATEYDLHGRVES